MKKRKPPKEYMERQTQIDRMLDRLRNRFAFLERQSIHNLGMSPELVVAGLEKTRAIIDEMIELYEPLRRD